MISKKMENAINEQINREIYSAYLYMSMSAYCTFKGFKGMGVWLMVQYHEEMYHALKMYNYLIQQCAQVSLMAIQQPPREFGTPLELFSQVLSHEQSVTKNINLISELAEQEKDRATRIFIDWYIKEQVEEEESATEIIGMLKMAHDNSVALMMIDSHLGKRTLEVQSDFSKPISWA